jgi:Phage integrase family
LKFVAHHLWDPAKRDVDPRHGVPVEVAESLRAEGLLRSDGPHAPNTVRRRLASWSTLHRWEGIEGPFAAPSLRSALRLAVRASPRPRQRKSKRAVTRDLAILLLAFASGGRRRSEVARLRVEQLRNEPPAPVDPRDADSPTLPCLAIQLGRTKTRDADEEGRVLLVGPPVEALREWLERADIKKGPIFCAIDRWEAVEEKALTPQSINLIVKRRCGMAGLEPDAFSAHGLRAGYLTEAARQGVALPEAMQQSQHRSVQQAASYYNDTERAQGRAARLAI